MNREWVEQKEAEREKLIAEKRQFVIDKINACDRLNEDQKKKLCRKVKSYEKNIYDTANTFWLKLAKMLDDDQLDLCWMNEFIKDIKLEDYIMSLHGRGWYRYQCLDSDIVEFDGDIIITDPCYIIKHRDESTRPKWSDYMRLDTYQGMTKKQMEEAGYYEDYAKLQEAERQWEEENPDDWDVCECGYNMGALGLKTYMSRSTIYGDWSCSTYNSDTKERIGRFCADAGQVAVFDLNEVLEYNPEYDDHTEKPWCVTAIKDFKGTVQFVVEIEDEEHNDYAVRVVGRGVNKITGEPLNFITSQTGF